MKGIAMHDVYTYRLDLSELELENLRKILQNYADSDNNHYISSSLTGKVAAPKKIKYSGKKGEAAKKATEARSKKAIEKMDNIIRLIVMQGIDVSELSAYKLAKEAGVAYGTARKYLKRRYDDPA
jgi:hypothetical protein